VATSLNRDDIIGGLRELIAELRASNEIAGIRLVGGPHSPFATSTAAPRRTSIRCTSSQVAMTPWPLQRRASRTATAGIRNG